MIFFAYMKSSMLSYSYRIHFKLLACERICVHKRLDYFYFLHLKFKWISINYS
jgi:hypothetical protein